MQLKLQRTQRMGGAFGNKVLFCLDARAEYAPAEQADIRKYKLGSEVIYSSRAAKKHLENAGAHLDRTQVGGTGERMAGLARGVVSIAMAKMQLSISIASLGRGHHIECKDLSELMEAEDAVMNACRNLRDYPPALNIFDVNRDRLGQYDEATKEQVMAGVIQTFDYLFNGLLGADLTAKQGVFFRFVARLMLALPETIGRNATILDLIDLMDDATPYQKAIESLPPIQRKFFERDFKSKTFAQTKEQIRYRLNAILENPTFARLFTSPKTKVDLFTELNNQSIILVDTAKDFLKGSSAHFGRIFISLVLQAVLERAALPEHERKPAFLIVDEAASYFDSNMDDLLTEARKYKLGCVFAHQFLDQCTQSLKSSLAANTSIKMASGVSMSDARQLAPDLRTSADFILSQPKLSFAAHIRNVTPQAVSIPVQVGALESQPRLPRESYERLFALNRLRVSLPNTVTGARDDGAAYPGTSDLARHDPTEPSEEW